MNIVEIEWPAQLFWVMRNRIPLPQTNITKDVALKALKEIKFYAELKAFFYRPIICVPLSFGQFLGISALTTLLLPKVPFIAFLVLIVWFSSLSLFGYCLIFCKKVQEEAVTNRRLSEQALEYMRAIEKFQNNPTFSLTTAIYG